MHFITRKFLQNGFLLLTIRVLRMPLRPDPSSLDQLSEAFKLPLVFIMRSAYLNQSPDNQKKVLQVTIVVPTKTQLTVP